MSSVTGQTTEIAQAPLTSLTPSPSLTPLPSLKPAPSVPSAPIPASSDTTNNIITLVVFVILLAGIGVLSASFPSYKTTILNAFVNTTMILGGTLITILAISILMNIYKPDGFGITLLMGFLGIIAGIPIVAFYTIYHLFWSVKKRTYFGLFPLMPVNFKDWGLLGFVMEFFTKPFDDSSGYRDYPDLLTAAQKVIYGVA